MKKISLIAFAAAAFSASSALAAAGSMYVGLNAGYQMIPGKIKAEVHSAQANSNVVPSAVTKSVKLKGTPKGADIAASFGYMVSDEFRTALSFQYNFPQENTYNKDGAINNANPKLKTFNSWGVLTNFYYDFLNTSSFTPFIGVSLGYGSRTYKVTDIAAKDANTKLADVANIDALTIKQQSKQNKKGFVFGGALGVAYKINHQLSLELAYAIQTLPKAETKLPSTVTANADSAARFRGRTLAHNINAGIRFTF